MSSWWSVLLIWLISCSSATVDPTPTWHRDVQPIVAAHCDECHAKGGIGGLVFDEATAPALADLMSAAIDSGYMPPWMPAGGSPAFQNDRRLSIAERDILRMWQEAGAPVGGSDLPDAPAPPLDPPALSLIMARPYLTRDTSRTDEYRCFLLEAPPMWIAAWRWAVKPSTVSASHHVTAAVLDEAGLAKARTLDGSDGFPGWTCDVLPGLGVTSINTLGSTGVADETKTTLPEGTSIFAPAGLALQMHYLPQSLHEPDQSGVDLWTTSASRPVSQLLVEAPVELPCPQGVSSDPSSACNRDHALRQVDDVASLDTIRAGHDALLARCGYDFDSYIAGVDFTQPDAPDHLVVQSSCTVPAATGGTAITVHPHMHTRASTITLEAQRADGGWDTLVDIPRWRWVWEATFTFVQPYPIAQGQLLRITCTFDNGNSNQWSVFTGPGHDQPAAAPLESPQMRVVGPRREDEMCQVFVQLY